MVTNEKKSIVMIVTCALMIALYVVLSFFALPIGGLKITFEHFPVVLCAVLYGPIASMLVGGIGEFMNQLFTYGLTPTTILWILPILARGLIIGLCARVFKKHMSPSAIVGQDLSIHFVCACLISGIVSSLFNTVALYVDSRMFGYYQPALVFGALGMRLLLSIVTSLTIVVAIKPIMHALRRAHLI